MIPLVSLISPVSNLIGTPTSMKLDKTACSICGEEGDGYHFGVEACRACTAFFRRSVSSGKTYTCRVDGKCRIIANVRCMCRACRYTKCIKVGMNPAGVQQRREILGKRVRKEESCSNQEKPSSSLSGNGAKYEILERMWQSYKKLESSRAIVHRRNDENLFMPKMPRNVTYKELALTIENEVSIVVDWVTSCFDEFTNLPCDQKRVLFRNFLMNFTLLQSAYLCHINNRDDVIIIASGDYIDMNNLQDFYQDEVPQIVSSAEAVRLFRKSFEMFRKSVILPMIEEQIDIYEFLALCTCALWDFGLDEQSDECIEIGRNVKERMLKELSSYLKSFKSIEDPSIRIAMLITLLPALNRSVRKFQEDVEVSNVFNIYAVPDQFYNILTGKFI